MLKFLGDSVGTFKYCFSLSIGRSDIEVAPDGSLFRGQCLRMDPPAGLSSPGWSLAMSRDMP